MSLRMSAAVAAAVLLVPGRTLAQQPALADRGRADAALARTAASMLAGVRTFTLENGLRVYLYPIANSPLVTTMVAYRVGSADEEADQTGLSHYLEHLLFKGTDKLLPGDVDRATQRNGGANNAYTSEDMTVYHFDFAADRWEIALQIEADRMRNTRIDEKHEFAQEKGAVVAELARNEDQPWDLEFKRILTLLYPAGSPYHHPVIGSEAHVRGATAEVIRRHYDKWYHPNNASLVIVGGFDPEKTAARVRELFSAIPRQDLPARKPAVTSPARTEPARIEFPSKFDLPRLLVGYNTTTVKDADDPALDVIQRVLSDGKTSRLYKKLVEDERIAAEVDAGNYTGKLPGWFAVNVELLPSKDRAKTERLIFAEMERLAKEPVSDAELNRARRKILANFVFGRESVHSLADTIARASVYTDGGDAVAYYQTYLDRLAALTPADIQKTAAKYFARNNASLVWSIPPDEEKKGAAPTARTDLARRNHRTAPRQDAAGGGAGAFSLGAAKRSVLPNGLTLITLEDHRLPMVVATAAVKDVTLREPADKAGIATLIGELLEEGTANHTGEQIATLIADTGGSLEFGAGGGKLRVLSPDTDLGLKLMFECLTKPTFPQDAFDRQKDQQLATIADAETQPRAKARQLFNKLVYKEHPFGRPSLGTKATVEKLTVADAKAFHAATFAPNATIVVVAGDFKTDELTKRVAELTKDWKKVDLAPANPAPPGKAEAVTERIVSDKSAAQVHVYIGHLGVTRQNPDYYKLLVMDNVLGVGPGFTDRLSSNLRDRQGLAYTVNASISSSAGNQPGTFTGYIGTFADKFILVRDSFVKEVARIRDEAPTPQEVDDAKKYLLGSLPFKFGTLSAVAGQLLTAEQYGLGFDFLDRYRKEVAAVTPADVQEVARRHLDPRALTIVAVGPIAPDGSPLVPPKKK
ncbi:insulinase family protein [bacterium]|nr:insulinase family protein [bacterium]